MAMRYRDKNDDPFAILAGEEDNATWLMEMYADFHPRGHYQGLPPLNHQTCLSWIGRLFKIGENFLASRDGRIIGHAALLPDLTLRDGEYLVFIHQDYRGQGIGTVLTQCALARSRQLGLTNIWLTVSPHNFIAIRLYKKCGFQFCGEASSFDEERKMELLLPADDP